jgi:hypothetical protein
VSAFASRRTVALIASSTIEQKTMGGLSSRSAVSFTWRTVASILSGVSTNGIVCR